MSSLYVNAFGSSSFDKSKLEGVTKYEANDAYFIFSGDLRILKKSTQVE